MTTTPNEPRAARQQLYELIRQDQPFDEKAHDVLAFAASYLGVDNGHLTRIDRETGEWTAMISTDTDTGATPPALELNLRETYCQRTAETNEQVSFVDAAVEEWIDEPTFETRELASYLGTPLVIEREVRGTVCFVSEKPRTEPFTDEERQFAELCAQLLEREVERERVRAERADQTNLAAVLNRVLRHNLRNEMSVIRGFTELSAETDEPQRKTVLKHIDEILDLCEKARKLDEVVTSTDDRTTTNIVALVETVADSVESAYPNASITVEGESSHTTAVEPSFERAIRELIENAASHAGTEPTVTVTIESVPDAIEITVSDDGPGLSEQERSVLKSGTETPLTHGSGLGLWLAHWIVTHHDGTIEPLAAAEGTVLTVSIPEKTAVGVEQSQPELLRARDTYHAAFEGAHDGLLIVNDDGRIIDANAAADAIFGAKPEALLGRKLDSFFPAQNGVIEEASGADGTQKTATVVGNDDTERVIEYTATHEIVPEQHLVVCRDVTARVDRERELSRKTQAIDEAPIGIILADPNQPDTPIVYANSAFCTLTGYDESEIVGRNCRFLQGSDTNEEAVNRLRDGIKDGTPVSAVVKNYRKDGTEFWNHVTIAPVGSGEQKRIVGFQREVSDRITPKLPASVIET